MPNLGVWEVDVILLLVLGILVVGRLSAVNGAAGRGLRRFGRGSNRSSAPPTSAPVAQPVPAVSFDPATGEPIAVVENKCPSCNTVNPTGQVFCGQCGTRLTAVA